MAAGGNTPPPNIQAWLSGPAGNLRRAALVRAGLMGNSPLQQIKAVSGIDLGQLAHEVAHPVATAQAIHNSTGINAATVPWATPVGEVLAQRLAAEAARNQLKIPDLLPARGSGPGKKAAQGLLRHVVDVRQYGHDPFINHADANAFATAPLDHLVENASSLNVKYGLDLLHSDPEHLAAIRRAAGRADQLMEQAGHNGFGTYAGMPTAQDLPPWERTLGEFMLSPHTVWHSTRTAPGLGDVGSALHAGTFNAAGERSVTPFTRGKLNSLRFLPGWLVAKDKQILPLEAVDPVSSFFHTDGAGIPFRRENAQTMVNQRRVTRLAATRDPSLLTPPEWIAQGTNPRYRQFDLIPYANNIEDAGTTSFQTTRRGIFKTHADFIKEALASGLDVSKALSSYRDPAALRKSLLVQLVRERSQGLRRG